MNISAQGLDFIKSYEAFVATPYDDGYGYLTIGYGHRIKPGERFTRLSHEEALQLLAQDVAWAEDAVNSRVRVPLTQSQFDALVSLIFNWGAGNFAASTHLQKLNAGDYVGAAQRISEHPITSNGRVSNGLIRRRAAESRMFLQQGLPGQAAPGGDLSIGLPNAQSNFPMMLGLLVAGVVLYLALDERD